MGLFRDSWEVWRRKVNEAIGNVEDIDADEIVYSNTTSGLTATNVQSAIDEVVGDVGSLDGADIAYDGTASSLSATTVQGAIDEVAGDLSGLDGEDVSYDNTTSGLSATNVQSAIDEVAGKECSLYSNVVDVENGVTVANHSWSAINSMQLTAGTYLVLAHVRFIANTSGCRIINIGTTSGWNGIQDVKSPASESALSSTLNSFNIITLTETTTIYLNAYQNSGGDLDANVVRLFAIKLS